MPSSDSIFTKFINDFLASIMKNFVSACGIKTSRRTLIEEIQSRLFGGSSSSTNPYPFLATVKSKSTTNNVFVSTAAIMSSLWVITAHSVLYG